MERAETIRIAGAKTITGLHWTRWRRTDETQVEAILAIGDTAGKLSLLLVQQSTGDEITLQLLPLPGPSDNDGRIITQMCSFEIDETVSSPFSSLSTAPLAYRPRLADPRRVHKARDDQHCQDGRRWYERYGD